MTRVIYNFEDICVNLYDDTVKKIGKEKTDFLWYKIGKDIAFRYFSLMGSKKIPRIFLPLVVEHIFKTFSSAGMSFAEKIEFNIKDKSLVCHGKKCVICWKTHSGHTMAGVVSGTLSSLLDENIEAEPSCINCPEKCIITANPRIREKYISDISEFKSLEDYNSLNFSIKKVNTNLCSLNDLFKFKKVHIDNNGKTYYLNKILLPSEIGLPGLTLKNYLYFGEEELFRKSIIKTSENIARDILEPDLSVQEKIKKIFNIISAFGWGIPFLKEDKNAVIINFVNPPVTMYGPLFNALVLNGYLNEIYKKKFKIADLSDNRIELH